jgi:hypothetical protein
MATVDLLKKLQEYNKPWCYQYQRRLDTIEEDKQKYGWTDEDLANISLDDFEFALVASEEEKKECKKFIERYEWLGTLSLYNSHYFAARYKGLLGGVIIMGMPNAFSKMLGEGTETTERLINRGASAAWTPKNLGSKFLMWCIRWMVNNTQYRLFTAYSDVNAFELGTIYMSLNFYCLGQKAGSSVMCINPYDKNKVINDRRFRARSFYKKYAQELGINWQSNWNDDTKMLWENIPNDIEKQLRDFSKKKFQEAEKIYVKPKWKWAFVLGRNRLETKQLRKKFLELNKTYPYPKERGK